jgi:hypothetical protein
MWTNLKGSNTEPKTASLVTALNSNSEKRFINTAFSKTLLHLAVSTLSNGVSSYLLKDLCSFLEHLKLDECNTSERGLIFCNCFKYKV